MSSVRADDEARVQRNTRLLRCTSAYGWPKVLKGLARRDQRVVHMSSRGGLLLIVYSSAIQVWTDTQVPTTAGTNPCRRQQ